jgi:hypothetical protein
MSFNSIWSILHLMLKFLCWIFVWMTYLLVRVLKSPTLLLWGISVLGHRVQVVFVLQSWMCWCLVHICLQLLHPLNELFLLSTWSDHFMFWLVLDMSIAILVCLGAPFSWNIFSHPFYLSLCLSFPLRFISCRQEIFGFCFLIQPTSLCLLIGELISLTFKVIIERHILV